MGRNRRLTPFRHIKKKKSGEETGFFLGLTNSIQKPWNGCGIANGSQTTCLELTDISESLAPPVYQHHSNFRIPKRFKIKCNFEFAHHESDSLQCKVYTANDFITNLNLKQRTRSKQLILLVIVNIDIERVQL